jgi:hypothetical protein
VEDPVPNMSGSVATGFGKVADITGMRACGNTGTKVFPGAMVTGRLLPMDINGCPVIGDSS